MRIRIERDGETLAVNATVDRLAAIAEMLFNVSEAYGGGTYVAYAADDQGGWLDGDALYALRAGWLDGKAPDWARGEEVAA